jgi:hypothetical protein
MEAAGGPRPRDKWWAKNNWTRKGRYTHQHIVQGEARPLMVASNQAKMSIMSEGNTTLM